MSAVRRSGDGFKRSSVKEVLEDPNLLKLFCDPRSDSDALYHHYGVRLRNVYCVELGEVAVRRQAGLKSRFVKGLMDIAQEFGKLSSMEWADWEALDRAADADPSFNFMPRRGGCHEYLRLRPLNSLALKYSALRVMYLRRIFDSMEEKLCPKKAWVKVESRGRVDECLLSSYDNSYEKSLLAPSHPRHWGPSTSTCSPSPEHRFDDDTENNSYLYDDTENNSYLYDDRDIDNDREEEFPNGFYHDEYGHYVPRP